MEYILINKNGSCGGIVGTEPTHSNWTLTPYLGGLIKELWTWGFIFCSLTTVSLFKSIKFINFKK